MRHQKPSQIFGHLLSVLALVILLTSAISSTLWYFIPVSFAYLYSQTTHNRVFVGLSLSALLILGGVEFSLFKAQLDYLSLSALILWGWVMAILGRDFSQVFKALGLQFLILVVVVAGWVFLQPDVLEWSKAQLDAHLLPILFREASWVGEAKYYYDEMFSSLFTVVLPGAYCFYLGLVFIFNLLLFRMTGPNRRGGMAFWEKFSRWRPKEWVLVPFVLGLVCLALSYEDLLGKEWDWLLWCGWNITMLSLYPISVNGLSIISYLLPRLGFFFVILTVFLFVAFNPYPFLILAGWADIWFDFRRRMRSNPKTD